MSMTRNTRIGVICGAVAVGMVGMAYASVPLYRMFCQATGFAGTPLRVKEASTTVIDKSIEVRFDGNVAPGLAWQFTPVVTTMTVKIGENALAFFRAKNLSDKPIVGSATYNVSPDQAGAFFNKIQCFCFTEQRLEPGETVDMPVSFFIDPAIVKDPDGARVTIITLSYTFHAVAHPKAGVAQRTNKPVPGANDPLTPIGSPRG